VAATEEKRAGLELLFDGETGERSAPSEFGPVLGWVLGGRGRVSPGSGSGYGNRASEVIARLRGLFSGRGAITESVDLNDATREVIALSRSELQKNRLILRTEFGDDLPPVSAKLRAARTRTA
jgi:hypothetical protein